MSNPFDVSLRVRLLYDAGRTAATAIGDMEALRAKAQQLGTVSGGGRLHQDLNAVTGAAGAASREIAAVGAATARFGSVSTVSTVARDLGSLVTPAGAARREIGAAGAALAKLGEGRGMRDLSREIESTARQTTELGRRLEDIQRLGRASVGAATARFAQVAPTAASTVVTPARAQGAVAPAVQAASAAALAGNAGGGAAGGTGGLGAAGVGALALRMGAVGVGGLVGAGAGYAAAKVAALPAHWTREAISFERAMTGVRAATGTSADAMGTWERSSMRLGQVTGIVSREIAGLHQELAQMGVPVTQLTGVTELSAKASVAWGMGLKDTGEALATLRSAYGIQDVQRLREAADAMTAAGSKSGTSPKNVLSFAQAVSGTASTFKMSPEQVSAFGAPLMGLGVRPDAAAGTFNTLASRMGNATREGDGFRRGLRGLGLNDFAVQARMQKEPVAAIADLLERINKLPDAKKPEMLNFLVGEGQAGNLSKLASHIHEVREALVRLANTGGTAGSLDRLFKTFSADTQASISRASVAMDNFATKLGQRFSPAVGAAARAVERLFGGMTQALQMEELFERSGVLAEKLGKGTVTKENQAELDADPNLRAVTERRAREAQEGRGVRDLREQERREPDEDARGRIARERIRGEMERSIRDLGEEVERRAAGGFEVTGDRRKLEALKRQYQKQFPQGGATELPGADKRSDLSDGARRSLASYHDTVEQSLGRTERLVHAAGQRMREDLALTGRVDDRFGGARLQYASLGGGDLAGVGPGAGSFGGAGSAGGGSGGGGRLGSARVALGRRNRFGSVSAGDRAGRYGGAISPVTRSVGHGAPDAEREAYIRAEAAKRGIDPDIAVRVAKSEGFGRYVGDQGTSFGDFQLHFKNNIRGLSNGGLGDTLLKEHGIDARDPRTWREQTQFALDEAAKGGWGPWHGWRGDKRAGLAGARAIGVTRLPQATAGRGQAGENGLFDPLGGAARRYTSAFGMRNHPFGGRAMHWGQDMAAPAGTGVLSMQGGRVTAIGQSGDVTVTHPDGSTKTYRHIDPAGIAVGQEVAGGQAIGKLRAHDPRSTGPHLHLEATDREGRRVDPMGDIEAANRRRQDVARTVLPVPPRWMARDGASREEVRTPRFTDPEAVRPRPPGEGPGGRSAAAPAAAQTHPPAVQNFYGGFDEQAVARRAQLEQNRQVRRAQAGALHDIGRVA